MDKSKQIKTPFSKKLPFGKKSKTRKYPVPSGYTLDYIQIKKLIAVLKGKDKIIMKLLAYMGLRSFEVAKIRLEDINFEEETIKLIRKFGKPQTLPIPPEILSDIEYYIKNEGIKQGYLFVGRNQGHLTRQSIGNITKKAGELAKIKSPYPHNPKYPNYKRYTWITPHMIRHSYGHYLHQLVGQKVLNQEEGARLMGHAKTTTFWDTYGTATLSELKERHKKVMEDI